MQNKKQLIIGITGNMGTGKSTVSSIISGAGGIVIDADSIAHKILEPKGAAFFEVVNMYGHNILTGSTIDRKKLAHIVFNDNKELKNLEAITHKHIIINVVEELQSLKDYKYIALDAPLLIETKLNRYVDETWLITSKLYKRISRIIKRDKLDYDEVIKRFESQTPFNELMKFADLIIYNNDKLSTLKKLILYRLEVSYAKNK